MNRYLLLLLLAGLPACFSNDPSDPKALSAEERVSERIAPWCDAACAIEEECESSTARSREACLEECYFTVEATFLGRGEACAEYGEQVMTCTEEAGCKVFTGEARCWSDEEAALCGEGAPNVSCDSGEGTGSVPGDDEITCQLNYEDCSDGHRYGLACTGTEDGGLSCICLLDGERTQTFELEGQACPSVTEMNEACGFSLE